MLAAAAITGSADEKVPCGCDRWPARSAPWFLLVCHFTLTQGDVCPIGAGAPVNCVLSSLPPAPQSSTVGVCTSESKPVVDLVVSWLVCSPRS